ncbi:MAG: trypsin-like peptidase domain-containing protein, partial [Myxococcales bacterium]|nr:trypsin-like peptidase domain-containing protein [Myxococcales bacterium]
MTRSTALVVAAGTLAATLALPAAARADTVDPDVIPDVAEKVVASVVNVSTTRQVDLGPWASDPFFNDPRSPWYLSPDQRKQQAVGSGVIVTAKGRILTNAHVVDGADEIHVTLADGTELDAQVLGVDARSDLAVLQLQGSLPALTPLAFGDSSKLRLGEMVLAVGDPFGVGQSVTMGIVSAKGRASVGIAEYEDFIQTDAAINPGNSGGALVNLRGELVGINTAIASRSGGYDGIGFAIPSNMAQPIMEALVTDGKVTRGYIGVALAPLTRAYVEAHHVVASQGVVVAEVVADGPAAHAGLEVGDVVVAADDETITDLGHLRNHIATRGADARLELTVMRGKRKRTIEVTTAALPDRAAATATGAAG